MTADKLYDQTGKLRLDLIPPEMEQALAEALGSGIDKKGYDDRRWEKGGPYMEHMASAKRHILKWLMGEDFDEQTGQPHLVLAAWRLLAIDTYMKRGIGSDNRPSKL
ncbi:MAG: hypothetical protein JKY94_01005 [Rhodobacteraceae bacterium]|nr:hypothetical protein [Paracoccaceae bacterium]